MFRQLGDVGLESIDAVLEMKLWAATRGSYESASGRSAAVVGVATDAQGEGLTPVAYAQDGGVAAAQSGMKGPEAVKPPASLETMKEPTRIAPRVMPASLARIAASMSMVRDRPELPRSALIIDMSAWKRAHSHPA